MKAAELFELHPSATVYDALTYLMGRAKDHTTIEELRWVFYKYSGGKIGAEEAKRLMLEVAS